MGELNANASNARLRTYVWGLDLSGTLERAGGVGGLLKVTDYTSGTTHHFVAYDGNGNVAALVDADTTGTVTARYEYGPFGEPIRATGTLARKNPLRFSTKYTDNETGLLYCGYRFYDPVTGRWPSRDPIGDNRGLNLYAFNLNDACNHWDFNGLVEVSLERNWYHPMWGWGAGASGHNAMDMVVARMERGRISWPAQSTSGVVLLRVESVIRSLGRWTSTLLQVRISHPSRVRALRSSGCEAS